MQKINALTVWSDNWWIEKEKAWFTGGDNNVLFFLDLNTGICEQMIAIPVVDISDVFRVVPRCIKCGNNIYCMPDMGSCIWVYNLDSGEFSKIHIDNPDKTRLCLYYFWFHNKKLFVVSMGLRKLIEIRVKEKKIERYYNFWKEDELICSIKNGVFIYSLYESGKIFQFHLETKQGELLHPPVFDRKFYCFCFDGSSFWMSGYKKEIIIWNYKENTLEVLNEFPHIFNNKSKKQDFCEQKDCVTEQIEIPIFYFTVSVGDKIWFIPSLENQIIYADKESHQLYVFEIEEENIASDSFLLNRISQKYILEYIKDNRYLGLYSTKNYCMLEIDTQEMTYRWCEYYYSEKCLSSFSEIYQDILQENDLLDIEIYNQRFRNVNQDKCVLNDAKAGMGIYKEMIHDMRCQV